jgi:phage terminase large subunit
VAALAQPPIKKQKWIPRKEFLKQIHDPAFQAPKVQYIDYEPRGNVKEMFRHKEREIILAGPAGTGKSRGALEKLHWICEKYPRARCLMLRKTRRSLTQSGIITYEQRVLPAPNYVPFHGGEQAYIYPNGSILAVGGLDDPNKLFSSDWDVIFVQQTEELNLGEWESLLRSLRSWKVPYQQVIGDCNPGPPTHWILSRKSAGSCTFLETRHEDNPELWNGYCPMHGKIEPEWTCRGREYISVLDAYTGVRFLRLRKGIWAAAEGIVYEDVWDAAVHVIDRFVTTPLDKDQVPKSWPRYWGVDFGYTNPFVWSAFAEDPDGRLFRYKEIYRTKTLVEDHAKRILEVTQDEPKPQWIVCDTDAEDRATLEKHLGMKTVGAWKSVSPGIQAVSTRLKIAGDGKPRLFYLKNSVVDVDPLLLAEHKPTCTEEEYPVYVWDTSNNRKRGEEPVKEFDHGQDLSRYVITKKDDTSGKKPKFFAIGSVTKTGGSGEGGSLARPSPWRMGGGIGLGTRWGQ